MWPFRKRKTESLRLVCDVGTSSVGVALVRFRSNNRKPVIIDHLRKNIPLRADVSRLLEDTAQTLRSAVQTLHDGAPVPIEHAHIVLAGAWADASLVHVHETYGAPTRVTQKAQDALVQSLQPTIGDVENDDQVVFERTVLETRVNGYLTDHPARHRALQFDAVVHVAAASNSILRTFGDAVQASWYAPVSHTSFGSLAYQAFRQAFTDKQQSGMILCVGGEVTELWQIEHGAPAFVGMAPAGVHSVIRSCARASGTELSTARSFVRLYGKQDIPRGSQAMIDQAMHAWMQHLDTLFENMQGFHPQHIVALVDQDAAVLWQEYLNDILVREKSLADVLVMAPLRQVETQVLYDVVEEPRDMFLSLEVSGLALALSLEK